MSFIKKLIYNGQYPLTGANKPEVCSFINDLTILYRQPKSENKTSNSYTIRCTDIILSKEYCLFSCTGSDGKIFSANIANPVIHTVYPLYSNQEYCGSISFAMIPSSVISSINMSDVFVNGSCILMNTSDDPSTISGLEGNKQIVVTGSLKTTIESDSEKTTVYIYPNEALFTEAASNVENSLGEDYGITTINGVQPDDQGRIGIVVSNYTCEYIPKIHQLTYITNKEITELCSDTPSAFSKIRCSAEDGEVISYPLDSFACEDTDHTVCAPVWDNQV